MLLRRRTSSRGPGRAGGVAVVAVLCLALAACGSRLDPDDVAAANGGSGVAAGQGGLAGDGGLGGGGGLGGADGTGTGAGGGAGSAAGGGGSGSAAGGGTAGGVAGGAPPAGGTAKIDCTGFKNQVGITDDTITIANVSDISGPVPGIFESAQEATRAFAAYTNANGGLCGRKLEVELLDSRADAGADQQAYARACDDAFAAVGSMSAFDSGGAQTAESCGIPDIRSASVNQERHNCSTCFAAQAVSPYEIPSAVHKWFLQNQHDATQHAAMLYINAGAAVQNAKSFATAAEKNGWNEVYVKGIDVSEFNYAPYVQEMKDAGVRLVQYVGPYQNSVKIQQAMQQQGFDPDVYLQDATIYDSRYVEQAGSVGDGSYVYMNNQMFDRTNIPEMNLYLSWLQQVKPGATPTFFGLYAWSAARLFVEQAAKLGGDLTRASLVAAMRKVDDWTSNDLHAPMHVRTGGTAECTMIIQLDGQRWVQRSPGRFICAPVTRVGG